ncbi:MAG: chemotaxis response regulator protein-glutamate methylesterase [Chloroflexi bacterium]|nr:chemotaxis response regulator protein-glutamate methylesterase [Chloroflexota bacterium]MDA1219546.1 chemotaxis response regulator protein-glutamate methylesterase [Chloroflexota bacterium]
MANKIKVLVVDDSAFARSVIAKRLEADPDLEVIDFAKDRLEALEKVKSLKPDVVTLDVSMPRMDGLEALERIMLECPTPVVMLSALTGQQTNTTISALERGAVDFFLKASVTNPAGGDAAIEELRKIIKAASTVTGARLRTIANWNRANRIEKPAKAQRTSTINKVVVIGTSTGGPKALADLIPALPGNLPAAVVLVQHMPPVFTKSLSERLNQASALEVKEAQEGDKVEAGVILVAPGGYHMVMNKDWTVSMNQNPQVCGVRPAVDVLMESVANICRSSTLGVVLTGMGSDGTIGSSHIKKAGGQVIVEDESTCSIYGMPKSIVDAGYADKIVPLNKMAQEIASLCNSRRPQKETLVA